MMSSDLCNRPYLSGVRLFFFIVVVVHVISLTYVTNLLSNGMWLFLLLLLLY